MVLPMEMQLSVPWAKGNNSCLLKTTSAAIPKKVVKEDPGYCLRKK